MYIALAGQRCAACKALPTLTIAYIGSSFVHIKIADTSIAWLYAGTVMIFEKSLNGGRWVAVITHRGSNSPCCCRLVNWLTP